MSSDPNPSGGSITDMAESGTRVPSSAAVPRVIKSVPNPGMQRELDDPDYNASAGGSLAGVATNATDIPRTVRDSGTTGEISTAAGDNIGAAVETKKLFAGSGAGGTASAGNDEAAKGHPRDQKAHKQHLAREEVLASDGPGVDPAPGEEELSQDELRSRRDGV